MYYIVLFMHSWTRWAILAAALLSLIFILRGLAFTTPRSKIERICQGAFVGFLDLQICLGLTLLFLSPLISWPNVHPWIYMHLVGMILSATVLHMGNSLAKKSETPKSARIKLLAANLLGLTLMAGVIPWPVSKFSRPLFRALEF